MKIQVHKNVELFSNLNSPIVSIGFFDGVHVGHKYLLDELISTADKKNCDHLLISMWPHPKSVVYNNSLQNFLLNSIDEKISHFESAGIKNLLFLDFTNDLAKLSGDLFVKDILKKKLKVSAILMGFNNSFGKSDDSKLSFMDIAKESSIEIINAKACCDEFTDIQISSSYIRELLIDGKLEEANQFLGYNYIWSGKVSNGYKIGRKLGFPTANLETFDIEKLLPGDGVYLVHSYINNNKYNGLLNIGMRPTFNRNEKSVELHILDFNKDIYNKECTLEFVKKLRNEKRFADVHDLKIQLKHDLTEANTYFKTLAP